MVSKLKRSWQNCMVEWTFSSKNEYADRLNEVELFAVFTDPGEEEKVVPAFRAGGNSWRVRYASHKVGRHHFRTVCSDKSNLDPEGQEGVLEVRLGEWQPPKPPIIQDWVLVMERID